MAPNRIHIAFFPLNILLLPGEQLPLHIFEPRYRQLIREAEELDIRFGLPFEDKEKGVHLASVCKLEKVSKRLKSGESDVIVTCEKMGSVVHFESQFPNKLYPGGVVDLIEDLKMDFVPSDELLDAFTTYIELRFGKAPTFASLAHYRFADVAASTGLSNQDKLKITVNESNSVREKILLNIIRYLNILLSQEKSIENGIILN